MYVVSEKNEIYFKINKYEKTTKGLNCWVNLPIKVVLGVHSSGEVQLYPGSQGVVQIASMQRVVESVIRF